MQCLNMFSFNKLCHFLNLIHNFGLSIFFCKNVVFSVQYACVRVHVGVPQLTCGSQETCGSADAGSLSPLSLSLTPGS